MANGCRVVRACLLTKRQLHGEQTRTASVANWPPADLAPKARAGTRASKALQQCLQHQPSGDNRITAVDRGSQCQHLGAFFRQIISTVS
jgi:hypothetical protein